MSDDVVLTVQAPLTDGELNALFAAAWAHDAETRSGRSSSEA